MSIACKSIVWMIVDMEATLYHCVSPTKREKCFFGTSMQRKDVHIPSQDYLYVSACVCVSVYEYMCSSESK